MNVHDRPRYSFSRAVLIYIVAVLFLFYEMGLQVSPSVMAADLMRDFHLDAGGLGIMAGFYFYSYSVMQLPAGLLLDRVGTRILITLAIFGCALGAFFFGNTYTIFWASAGRFLMGVGSAFAFTGVLVVAANWFRPHHFAVLVGAAQLFAALGAMGGAFPLALLVARIDWRLVLIGLSFLGVFLSVIAWLIIRDHPKEKIAGDVFKNPRIKESLSAVFSKPQNWWIALYAFAGWAPMAFFAALWGGPFLQARFGVSNELAASSLSLMWIGLAAASPLVGWLSDVLKRRCLLMMICALVGVFASLILIYLPKIPFWTSYIWMFLLGVASAGQILTFALVKDLNKPTVIATAIGFNNMAVVLGGAIFQPLVGLLLRWNWNGTIVQNAPYYSQYVFSLTLFIIPLCYLVCFALSTLVIHETGCKPSY